MLYDSLQGYTLILGSASPRRQRFFREMGLEFNIRLKPVEEVYPDELKGSAISDYLAELKASAFDGTLAPKEILITSDTVVWHRGRSLAKAADAEEAMAMLKTLSGEEHDVITSVCFTIAADLDIIRRKTVHQITKVRFKELTGQEIRYYVENYDPFDKAGAYGIQEWIGLIGIESIEGSYPNVVGLPTQLVYKTLKDIVE